MMKNNLTGSFTDGFTDGFADSRTSEEVAKLVVGLSPLRHVNVENKLDEMSKVKEVPCTGSSSTITLKNLRKTNKVTQAQMASRLGITQANVSRIESRADMMLSTLSSYIQAVDAEVEILVRIRHDVFKLKLEESRGLKHGFKIEPLTKI